MAEPGWTAGRILTLAGFAILIVSAVTLGSWVVYRNSGVTPCGEMTANVVSSGTFHDPDARGQHTRKWQHLVETPDGELYQLLGPSTVFAEGTEIQITLRCNRSGERLFNAWYRPS